MKTMSLAFLAILLPPLSLASVNCGSELISEILIYDHKIVVKQGNRYRGLGHTTTAKNQDKMLSLVLTAKAAGIPVVLVYPDGYDCSVDDYSADPEMIILK